MILFFIIIIVIILFVVLLPPTVSITRRRGRRGTNRAWFAVVSALPWPVLFFAVTVADAQSTVKILFPLAEISAELHCFLRYGKNQRQWFSFSYVNTINIVLHFFQNRHQFHLRYLPLSIRSSFHYSRFPPSLCFSLRFTSSSLRFLLLYSYSLTSTF